MKFLFNLLGFSSTRLLRRTINKVSWRQEKVLLNNFPAVDAVKMLEMKIKHEQDVFSFSQMIILSLLFQINDSVVVVKQL